MSLRDAKIPIEELEIGGARVSLRALSLADIGLLLETHGSGLSEAVSLYAPVLNDPAYGEAFAVHLLAKSPSLVAMAIAISAGEPESADIAARLPAGPQLRAFASVLKLTLANENAAAVLELLAAAVAPLISAPAAAARH